MVSKINKLHVYELCDSEGVLVLKICSAYTLLDYEGYYLKHIKPIIPVLSATHGTTIDLDNRG